MMRIKRLTQAVAFATVLGAAGAMPAFAESTNSVTFEGWANDTAVRYNGRIPRDIYLDEMGRRWDADATHRGTRELYLIELRSRWDVADRDNSGLTPADISRLTGNVDSSTAGMPRSGAGAQPGNMGPANSKGQ
jgi:hypothetical protein